jgi:hypothetical protein
MHLDRRLEVLHRQDGPDLAVLGLLALDAGDHAADRDRALAGPSSPMSWAMLDVAVRREDVLEPLQRMVADVQPEHLPLEGQAGHLLPLVQSRAPGTPRAQTAAGGVRRTPEELAEQVVLAVGLIAFEVDHLVDLLLEALHQARGGCAPSSRTRPP